jgi:ATP-dependent Clp protease ATP-binding subunit ClpB
MDIERFTQKSQQALQQAVSLASERGHTEVAPLHLLHALLGESEGAVYPALNRVGVTPTDVRRRAEEALGRTPAAHGSTAQPGLSRPLAGPNPGERGGR